MGNALNCLRGESSSSSRTENRPDDSGVPSRRSSSLPRFGKALLSRDRDDSEAGQLGLRTSGVDDSSINLRVG